MEHGVWQWVAPDPTFAAATTAPNSTERPSVAFQEDSEHDAHAHAQDHAQDHDQEQEQDGL
eukprot:scaffold48659_cov35-Attheya_sp.AAC.1